MAAGKQIVTARVVRGSVLYFILVFGSGFVLGVVRELLAAMYWSERTAELMEMPIMFVVIVFSARWVARRSGGISTQKEGLAIGLAALTLMIGAEFAFAFFLRGLTVRDYLAGRDPIAGTVYLVVLGIFAVMPALLHQWSITADRHHADGHHKVA